MIEKILNKIEEYECICLYRHVNPDYDAFGSQFGMYDLIQNTFENKEVYFAGDFSSDLVAKYQFNGEINEPNFVYVKKLLKLITILLLILTEI